MGQSEAERHAEVSVYKILQGLREAVAVARSEAAPARVHLFEQKVGMRDQRLVRRVDLTAEQNKYRDSYAGMWPGCKGYCVAGSGGSEPDTGLCQFCGYSM